jgi:hypothetical protein
MIDRPNTGGAEIHKVFMQKSFYGRPSGQIIFWKAKEYFYE